jgi:multidrug efflux pump subunit AcrA (membrane-fusion protein)
MTERTGRPWLNYLLGLLCLGAIVAAILVVGPASGSQTAATRTAKAMQGVVQSTVSGSGNLQPANQLNLGFKTSGTVTSILVTQGEHVTQGQLLATLDPQSAEVTLEQAKAALLSAEANLVKEEEEPTSATPTTTSQTSSAPSKSAPSEGTRSTAEDERGTGSTSASQSPTVSAAEREASIASAKATVKSDKLTVQSAEEAVQDTKLYAPEDGTIVSLSGQVGEVVSASGTTKSSSSSSSGSSGSGASAAGGTSSSGRSAATGTSSSSSSASSSGSSSSSFAVLSDLSSMQLVVALSESEIGHVKVGQIATVTVEALEGRKLAAHVSEVAILSTSSSGVVSYDVTFQLDQMESGLKPGMSATAEVVVKQAEGVNVPTSAITAGSVTVVRGGKVVRQSVMTGLAGNSSTIVLSGLKAGETVVLPAASASATSLTSRLSRLAGGAGGLGGAGGGRGGLAGGGGAAFFRGGG